MFRLVQLCGHDANLLFDGTARTKVERYQDGHANRNGTTYTFLPCAMSTLGRIHGGFLRLLCLPTHLHTRRIRRSLVLSFYINQIGASDQAWGAITTVRGLVQEP